MNALWLLTLVVGNVAAQEQLHFSTREKSLVAEERPLHLDDLLSAALNNFYERIPWSWFGLEDDDELSLNMQQRLQPSKARLDQKITDQLPEEVRNMLPALDHTLKKRDKTYALSASGKALHEHGDVREVARMKARLVRMKKRSSLALAMTQSAPCSGLGMEEPVPNAPPTISVSNTRPSRFITIAFGSITALGVP